MIHTGTDIIQAQDLYGGKYKQLAKKDFELAKKVVNSLVPIGGGPIDSDEYKNMISNYRLYNNHIELEDLKEVCDPFNAEGESITFFEKFIPINPATTKIDTLLGEELKRREIPKVIVINAKSIAKRDVELQNRYREASENIMEMIIEEESARLQNATDEQLQQIRQNYQNKLMPDDIDQTKFMSEIEILGNDIIKYATNKFNIRRLKNQGFKHGLLSDAETVWVGMYGGKPTIRLMNRPDVFWFKSKDTECIEDGDAAGSRTRMSIGKIFEIYGNVLSESDKEKLLKETSYGPLHKDDLPERNVIKHPRFKTVSDKYINNYGNLNELDDPNYGAYGNDLLHQDHIYNNQEVWVVHLEFKVQRKVGFHKTIHPEYNTPSTEIVDESFPIPPNATTRTYVNKFKDAKKLYSWTDEFGIYHSIEWNYITVIMEATRIHEDIFVNVREKPFQFVDPNDPYNVPKLGYHGLVYNATNAKSISLMGKIRPATYLYFIIIHQMVTLLSGINNNILAIDVDQLPDELLKEEGYEGAFAKALMLAKKGIYVFSSSQHDGNGVPNTRGKAMEVVPNTALREMMELANLASWLEGVIGSIAGISHQREGQMQRYTNATDNQQAIIASSNVTEIYFYNHMTVWNNVMQTYVNLFKNWAKDFLENNPDEEEIVLSYVLSDSGIQTLRISKKHLDDSVYGAFTTEGAGGKEYIDAMEQFLLPLVQNQMEGIEEISMILKSKAEGTSPEEMNKMITAFAAKRTKQRQREAQQQQEYQKQLVEENNRVREDLQAHEIEKIRIENELRTIRELRLKQMDAEIAREQKNKIEKNNN